MRKLALLLILISFSFMPAFSRTADSKNYPVSANNCYMLTISALKKLNFKIIEMQTTSGYILFQTPSKEEYLVTVSEAGETASNVKVSKLKSPSPLIEIQDLIYNEIARNLNNLPKRADL